MPKSNIGGYKFIGRKNSGASKKYKSTSEMILNYGKKPRKVRLKVNKGKKPKYKVPKTPKDSGRGWGG